VQEVASQDAVLTQERVPLPIPIAIIHTVTTTPTIIITIQGLIPIQQLTQQNHQVPNIM